MKYWCLVIYLGIWHLVFDKSRYLNVNSIYLFSYSVSEIGVRLGARNRYLMWNTFPFEARLRYLPLAPKDCYASAFRRRRHYVFRLSVHPSEAWNTLFWPVHGSVGPPDQPWPFYGMSVRPSVEVSGYLPEYAWREWPEILHADVSWPSSELISLWPRSVDFSNFGTILT